MTVGSAVAVGTTIGVAVAGSTTAVGTGVAIPSADETQLVKNNAMTLNPVVILGEARYINQNSLIIFLSLYCNSLTITPV
jgi:hypothetical protein